MPLAMGTEKQDRTAPSADSGQEVSAEQHHTPASPDAVAATVADRLELVHVGANLGPEVHQVLTSLSFEEMPPEVDQLVADMRREELQQAHRDLPPAVDVAEEVATLDALLNVVSEQCQRVIDASEARPGGLHLRARNAATSMRQALIDERRRVTDVLEELRRLSEVQ
jgi:uncharacterized protein (DUF885 family)